MKNDMKNSETKLQLFELGWFDEESSDSFIFIHSDKTQEQFKEDVHFLLKKYGKEYIENLKICDSVDTKDWVLFIVDKVPELGYQPINTIKQRFYDLTIEKMDNYRYNSHGQEWKNIVGDDLLELAMEQSAKARKFHQEATDEDWEKIFKK